MIEAIGKWLSSEKDYSIGLALYLHYQRSSKQARILSVGGATSKNQKTLFYELSKLCQVEKKEAIAKTPQTAIAPILVKVPEEIDLLKKEQKSVYKILDNLHSILPYQVRVRRKEIAFQILSLDDKLKELFQSLDNYDKHGILPVKEQVKPVVSEGVLLSQLLNLRSNISKDKARLSNAKTLGTIAKLRERLEKRQLELEELNKKLSR